MNIIQQDIVRNNEQILNVGRVRGEGELIPIHVGEQLTKKPETPIMAKAHKCEWMLTREDLIRMVSIYTDRMDKQKWMGETVEYSR